MEQIVIRFKSIDELNQSNHSFPFVITIDGVEQENVKRFSIDLDSDQTNIENYSYTIEKYMDYPNSFFNKQNIPLPLDKRLYEV